MPKELADIAVPSLPYLWLGRNLPFVILGFVLFAGLLEVVRTYAGGLFDWLRVLARYGPRAFAYGAAAYVTLHSTFVGYTASFYVETLTGVDRYIDRFNLPFLYETFLSNLALHQWISTLFAGLLLLRLICYAIEKLRRNELAGLALRRAPPVPAPAAERAPALSTEPSRAYPTLNAAQVEAFVRDGFVRVVGMIPEEALAAARAADAAGAPFDLRAAAPDLEKSFDQLIGDGRWRLRSGLAPLATPPEALAEPPAADGEVWRADPWLDAPPGPRALHVFILLADVGPWDPPLRLRVGSHAALARRWALADEAPPAYGDLDRLGAGRPKTAAVGAAGAIYLCHPFLIHATRPNEDGAPAPIRAAAVELTSAFRLNRQGAALSPTEVSIQRALQSSS